MAWTLVGHRDGEPTPELLECIGHGRLGGLLWFRSALGGSVREARARIADLRRRWPPGVPCIFAADEEGGLIQQLSGLVDDDGAMWHRLPSARALGRCADAEAAYRHGREIGRRLLRLGLDTTLAPVLDLDPGEGSGVLATRAFSEREDEVARLGIAWARGLASSGARCCVKHFPGHGGTRADTHVGLARLPGEAEMVRHRRPFAALAASWNPNDGPPPGVMPGHLLPAVGSLPATFDDAVIGGIPARLGAVFSDSLDMGALAPHGDVRSRGARAAAAGIDMLVVGVEIDAGLALARDLEPSTSPRLAAWLEADRSPGGGIEPLSFQDSVRVAACALRVSGGDPMEAGEWDWVLPIEFSPYGDVPDPPVIAGVRRRVRILRFDARRPETALSCLDASPAGRPALLGWIQRGSDPGVFASVSHHRRIRALAFLLGVPAPETQSQRTLWTAETTGFGDPELHALAAAWANAPAAESSD